MSWRDYEMIWKRQSPPVGALADVADLKATFEAKKRKLYAALKIRDYSEAGVGLLISPVFIYLWWQLGSAGWPIGIGVLLILGICLVFVRERFRVRRMQLGAEAPLLNKVESCLEELNHQRELLLSMWKWYLGPLAVAMALFGEAIRQSRPSWDISHDPLFRIGFGVFCGLLFWFAWEINRRAVRKQIEPRIVELKKLRDYLITSKD